MRSVTLSSSNNWTDNTTWAALPVYTVDGVRITYTLTESGKGKYKAEYKINYGDGTTKAGTGETLDVNIYVDRVVDATFTNTLEFQQQAYWHSSSEENAAYKMPETELNMKWEIG